MLDLDRYKVRKAYKILIHDESDTALNFVDRILKYPKDRQDVDKLFKNYCVINRNVTSEEINTIKGMTRAQKKYLERLWSEKDYALFHKKCEEFKTGTYTKTK